jgi:hypothetical protein
VTEVISCTFGSLQGHEGRDIPRSANRNQCAKGRIAMRSWISSTSPPSLGSLRMTASKRGCSTLVRSGWGTADQLLIPVTSSRSMADNTYIRADTISRCQIPHAGQGRRDDNLSCLDRRLDGSASNCPVPRKYPPASNSRRSLDT